MTFKQKLSEKILAVILAGLLVLNPLAVPVVWAEEEENAGGDAAQEVLEETQDSQLAVEETPAEPTGGNQVLGDEASITTGDATALAETETTANTHADCVDGQVFSPEGVCAELAIDSQQTAVANDNLAEVAAEASGSATTGGNQITGGSGSASIDSGDAQAGATIENEVNTNTVQLVEQTAGETEEETEEAESLEEAAVSEEEDPVLTVENSNEATVENQAGAFAGSGDNQANDNNGLAEIQTGQALAYANILNLLNANIVGSDFEIYLQNLLDGQEGDIDLNQIWQELIASGRLEQEVTDSGGNWQSFLIQNENLADLVNQMTVEAGSGGNQANGNESAEITTGDATALANVINLINLNLVGSQFFLGVINIFGSFVGDLILPRPENFLPAEEGSDQGLNQAQTDTSPVVFENQNQVGLNDSVTASADSGQNQTLDNAGDNLIQTGDAVAQANSFSLVNTNLRLNNWFFLIINHLGSWSGRIFGWLSPEAEEEAEGREPLVFQLGTDNPSVETAEETDGQPAEAVQSEAGQPEESLVRNLNRADLTSAVRAEASTGQNRADRNQGGATIRTGKALALANLFNLVNFNALGGRWFFGLVNILGDWTGNTIFAYPDVAIALSNGSGQAKVGEQIHYTLNYKNQGYDTASDVVLNLILPEGIQYRGDSSGLPANIDDRNYSWYLGSLAAGQEGSFVIDVQVDIDFSFASSKLSFWSRIIPQALAAEEEQSKEVVAVALIGTVDPESDSSNNSSSAATVVYSFLDLGSQAEKDGNQIDQSQPVLEITAKNNVGEFVYPGDVVTFEITIRNIGEGTAYDVYLIQNLFNGIPHGDYGAARFEIGTIEPGKKGTLTFGLALADDGVLPAETYHTTAQAFGLAANGNEAVSNEAKTDFKIRLRDISSVFEVRAKDEEDGNVLGAFIQDREKSEDILPYVLLFLLSSAWLVEKSKAIRLARKEQ